MTEKEKEDRTYVVLPKEPVRFLVELPGSSIEERVVSDLNLPSQVIQELDLVLLLAGQEDVDLFLVAGEEENARGGDHAC